MALCSVTSALSRSLRSFIPTTVFACCRRSVTSDGNRFTNRNKEEIKFKNPFDTLDRTPFQNRDRPPYETDVLVIGGGVIGSSIAYHLTRDSEAGLNVLVVEQDNTEHLCVDDADPPDVQFNQGGYLILASESGAEQMVQNHQVQKEFGAMIELMTAKQLQNKFPWLNTDGVALGSYGYENEGWFDPWLLLKAFKEKALSLGATYVQGEVTGFNTRKTPQVASELPHYTGSGRRVDSVKVRLPNSPETIPVKCSMVVLAAGAWSGQVAELLDIGRGSKEDLLDVCLPVCPRKRYLFVVHVPDGPGLDCPLLTDLTGAYFRREGFGGNYLCGRGPLTEADEPSTDNLQVDYEFFDEHIWPVLAHRVPAFENLKVKSAWAGYYDYNTLDQNAIIGTHPAYPNMYLATGFSGHGIQQSPAVGLAISDLILHGKFSTLDLSQMGFDRIMQNRPLREKNIY